MKEETEKRKTENEKPLLMECDERWVKNDVVFS